MPWNSKNFQHIEQILRSSIENSVLQIPIKFQVIRIKIVRVLLLDELKNTILRTGSLKFAFLSTWTFDAEGYNFEN